MRLHLWAPVNGAAQKFAIDEAKKLTLDVEVLTTTDVTSAIAAAVSSDSAPFALLVNVAHGYREEWKTAADALLHSLPPTGWAVVGSAGFSPLTGIVASGEVELASTLGAAGDVLLPLSNVEPDLLLLNLSELKTVELTPAAKANAAPTKLSFELISAGKAMFWSPDLGRGGPSVRRIPAVGRFATEDMAWIANRSRTTLVKTARRDYLIRHSPDATPLSTGFDVERESVRLAASALGAERSLKIALVFGQEPNVEERKRLDVTRRAFEIAAGNVETSVLTTDAYTESTEVFDWSIPMPKGAWPMAQAASLLKNTLLSGRGYAKAAFGAIGVLEAAENNGGDRITDHRFTKPKTLELAATVYRVAAETPGANTIAPPIRVDVPLLISPAPHLSLVEAGGILGVTTEDLTDGLELHLSREVGPVTWLRTLAQLLRDENNYRRALRIFNLGDLRRLQRKLLKSRRSPNQGGSNQ